MTDHGPAGPSFMTPSSGPATTNGSSAPAAGEAAARQPVAGHPVASHLGAGRKVHFVLQGKGGVGKTLAASLLAQFYRETGDPAVCLDTDPVNGSFSAIRALGASHLKLLHGDKIDTAALDDMMERILTEDAHFVADSGAASFLPLSRYLVEHAIADLIADGGKQAVIHTVLTGGPAMLDTAKALDAIAGQFPAPARIVVWLNEYFGPVVTQAGEGFERTPLYQRRRDRIAGIVRLERLNPDTAGRDVAAMLGRQLTFAEADQSPDFRIVARQRLRQVWRPIRDQIARVA